MLRSLRVVALLGALGACDEGTVRGGPDSSPPWLDRGAPADLLRADGAVVDASPLKPDVLPDAGPDQTTTCQPIPGVSYDKLAVSQPCGCDPATHGDMNLLLRSWQAVSLTKGLVSVNGPTDGNAPQLYTLFGDERVPAFPAVYQVQQWDWGCNCPKGYITSPEVTLAGMTTTPGEVVHAPLSGYDIGAGHTAILIHAGGGTLTLKYTAEDNVVSGYTIHLDGVCVEPSLKALYDQCHAAGRVELPALSSKQSLGRALGAAIRVAIRDTGSWMDPRVKKDWWQGK